MEFACLNTAHGRGGGGVSPASVIKDTCNKHFAYNFKGLLHITRIGFVYLTL